MRETRLRATKLTLFHSVQFETYDERPVSQFYNETARGCRMTESCNMVNGENVCSQVSL